MAIKGFSKRTIDWLWRNKKWVFSGIGVAVAGWIGVFLFHPKDKSVRISDIKAGPEGKVIVTIDQSERKGLGEKEVSEIVDEAISKYQKEIKGLLVNPIEEIKRLGKVLQTKCLDTSGNDSETFEITKQIWQQVKTIRDPVEQLAKVEQQIREIEKDHTLTKEEREIIQDLENELKKNWQIIRENYAPKTEEAQILRKGLLYEIEDILRLIRTIQRVEPDKEEQSTLQSSDVPMIIIASCK